MEKYLEIICLVLVGTTVANSQGYNYQQQNFRQFPPVNNNNGIYPAASFNVQSPPIAPPVPQYSLPKISAPSNQYIPPSTQYGAPQSPYQAPRQQQTIISKDIYIHSAPEETEEIRNDLNSEVGPIRKNYRIVFIKAPSHNIRFTTQYAKQAQASNEEKTVIYVLAKKPDIANIQNDVSVAQSEQKASKPEVYFIKYKTQDEALRAQQEIQAQYESLGGSTQISDEGIAPVTSVIGGGGVNGGAGGSFGGGSFASNANFAQSASNIQQQIAQSAIRGPQTFQGSQSVNVPSRQYLPPRRI